MEERFNSTHSEWRRAVSISPQLLYARDRMPVPIECEAGWAPGPVLDVTEKLQVSNPGPYREWSGHYTDYVIPAPRVCVVCVCVCVCVCVYVCMYVCMYL